MGVCFRQPPVDDYYDFNNTNAPQAVSGHFVQVPKEIATGRNPDGTDMMAADVPPHSAARIRFRPATVAGSVRLANQRRRH